MKRLLETKRLIDILDVHPDIALETLQRARMAAFTLVKWLLCSVLSGSVIGLVGASFLQMLTICNKHPDNLQLYVFFSSYLPESLSFLYID